jgi:tripartite-type tricarboxylate transporter receptor subunit TctC
MGSGGKGTSQHVAGELCRNMTGIDMAHILYPGDVPAVAALLWHVRHHTCVD